MEHATGTVITARLGPTLRQTDFLLLTCLEALYGGAAGGGKSEALLLWLSEGVHIPGYSGIIFRRTYAQLEKSNEGLIAKSKRMYLPLGGRWNGSKHQWTFPSGAIIDLGHLQFESSTDDYTGPSYHRIAFDEANQFSEAQYLFMLTRLRGAPGFPIPLGVRCASNPGGKPWLQKRFVPPEALAVLRGLTCRDPSRREHVWWPTKDRAFVPARLADNPFIDFDQYAQALSHVDPVTRERLLNGDWSVREDGKIRPEWLRRYVARGGFYHQFTASGGPAGVVEARLCTRFTTVDCAGTSAEKAAESKGKTHSWSVISTWDQSPQSHLFLVGCRRGRWEAPELLANIREEALQLNSPRVGIENANMGSAIYQMLCRDRGRFHVFPLEPGGKDKATRAAPALNMMEAGKIWFPHAADAVWMEEFEAELLSWTGHPDEQADQIDTLAYAAMEAGDGPRVVVWAGA